jgi:hypothetical protein
MKVDGIETTIDIKKKGNFVHFHGDSMGVPMDFYIDTKNNKFYGDDGQLIGKLDFGKKSSSIRKQNSTRMVTSRAKLDVKETTLSIKMKTRKSDLKNVEKQVKKLMETSNSVKKIDFEIKKQKLLFNHELSIFAFKGFCFAITCIFFYYSGLLDKLFGVADKVVDKVIAESKIWLGLWFSWRKIIRPFVRRVAGLRR